MPDEPAEPRTVAELLARIDADWAAGFDAANSVIQARSAGQPLAEVRVDLATTHAALRATLAGLTDADLFRTYSSYLPDESGTESGAPILNWIAGNTYDHYREHIDWIGRLVAAG